MERITKLFYPQLKAGNHELVEVLFDRGPPKRWGPQSPALARMAEGAADVLVIARAPRYRRQRVPDRLEQACPPGQLV